MKILFLSHYFPPEVNAPASRTFEHCRQWVKKGHEVTVVTCVPNHPRGEVYPGYRNRIWFEETRDGIRVIRLLTYLSANSGFFHRTLNYVWFMFACILAIPRLPKADILISTSPQFFNGLAGFFVSRVKRCPWVLEIRDLWPESILAVGAINSNTIIRILYWLEKFCYKKAQAIVPVTDAFARYMFELGIDKDKITVIKNGVLLELFDYSQSGDELRQKFQLENKIVAAYFGTHGMAHHLETVLEAAEQLREDPRIIFVTVGDGAEFQKLLQIKTEKKLDNVRMLGQQPKELMPQFWAMADISLVVLRHSALFKTVIPSKIFEAMAMHTPIVLGVEGESREIVEQAGAGLCVPPEDSGKLAQAVLKMADSESMRSNLGKAAAVYVAENFDRTVLAGKYLDLLHSLVTSNAADASGN